MKRYVVGIDVGGTNIKLGLINRQGRIVSRSSLITKRFVRNKGQLISALCETVKKLISDNKLKKSDIEGIGIGLPGLIDPRKGVVKFLPNIPGWKNVALKRILEQKLKIPTFLDNDVNLITLAEWKFGAGVGVSNMLCLTLGTGVGGGLILDGKLYRGEGFVAGELGHMPLNESGPKCTCGGVGCFERYVGNKTLEKNAAKVFKKNIKFQQINKMAAKGNKTALKFWGTTGTQIGNGLIGVINLLNPTLVIIGGGISNNYKFLSTNIKKVIKTRAMTVQAKMAKVVRAKLGDDAGIIGAQVLVKGINEK